jgi:hypothetical protein
LATNKEPGRSDRLKPHCDMLVPMASTYYASVAACGVAIVVNGRASRDHEDRVARAQGRQYREHWRLF